MKLHAVSDLHLGHKDNRRALHDVTARPDDWLILAGDIGETCDHLRFTFDTLAMRFKQLVWVPGNHELWTLPTHGERARGQEKYEQLIEVCREYGVLTPEDPYPVVTFEDTTVRVVPLFLLYDYSFRPASVPRDKALDWALESGIMCTDEKVLHPDPFPDVSAWCHARCAEAEERLSALEGDLPTILINHFPLRYDLARLPRVPRFSLWCGTRITEDWHQRFNALAVISGHLHIRSTRYRDGTRFEEVSLGYPRQWRSCNGINDCIREILPGREKHSLTHSLMSRFIDRL